MLLIRRPERHCQVHLAFGRVIPSPLLWDRGRLARLKQRVQSVTAEPRKLNPVAFNDGGRGARGPSKSDALFTGDG